MVNHFEANSKRIEGEVSRSDVELEVDSLNPT